MKKRKPPPCVVHSFDGTAAEAADLLSLPGVYIGINGCSLRSEASLEVVRTIPLDRLMLETDAPWCSIKNTHPGKPFVVTEWATKDKKKAFRNLEEACVSGDEASRLAEEARLRDVTVKDRSEPCHIAQVAEVLAAARGRTRASWRRRVAPTPGASSSGGTGGHVNRTKRARIWKVLPLRSACSSSTT